MLLKAHQLIVLAFVSLVTSKCQRLILLRKSSEYFHVNITIKICSHLNVVIYSSNNLNSVFYTFKFFLSLICFFFKLCLTSLAISWISGVAGLASVKPPGIILANCSFAGQDTGTEVIRLAWRLQFLKRMLQAPPIKYFIFHEEQKGTGKKTWVKFSCFLTGIADRNLEEWGTGDEQRGLSMRSHAIAGVKLPRVLFGNGFILLHLKCEIWSHGESFPMFWNLSHKILFLRSIY